MRFSIFFHLLLYPFPIPSQFHMFYFWNPPSLLSVANIGVVASSLNTPNSLSSSHYQLSVALQLEVGPGDPPSLIHEQTFVWIDLVRAMCMQCSFHEFMLPLACHSMKTLSQHSQPLLLVLRIFSTPLLSLGRRECDRFPTIVSLHLDLLWVSLWIAIFAKGGVKGALICGWKGKLLGSC